MFGAKQRADGPQDRKAPAAWLPGPSPWIPQSIICR